MSDALVLEALARVEHKLDLLLHSLGRVVSAPMEFAGAHTCPVCLRVVSYRIDFQHNVVKRVCGCSTGMQPLTLDLSPVTKQPQQGVKNDGSPDAEPERAAGTEHGRRG